VNPTHIPLEAWRPDGPTPIDTSDPQAPTIAFTPTPLHPTQEDPMTTSTDLHTTPTSAGAPDSTGSAPGDRVVLHLVDRSVAFTGTQVGSIPACDGSRGADHEWPVVYLTAKGNIAVHDPAGHTLTVHTVAEFSTSMADTPVSWIVADVLAQLPRTLEELDV
jgi:hypothetical protein